MPDLQFAVEAAEPQLFSAAPLLVFKLRVTQPPEESPTAFHSVALRCQIRIEPARRRYNAAEQSDLFEVFGRPQQWGQTLRSMLWTHAQAVVGPFTGSTTVELPVPCSYDFNLAATKYFHALEGDEVPLCLLFSGTMFYAGADGALQVGQISWEREANFRLGVRVWREMMEHYYPNSAWLRVPRDVFDRLSQYKVRQQLPTWDAALERLLAQAEAAQPALAQHDPQAVP
ncbi:MAG TPA: DUF6084 family protein [Pirellulales bacterium]|jgi:hypothetical protein|nr:DUF6084 family protein [Pirellulales bacterium]